MTSTVSMADLAALAASEDSMADDLQITQVLGERVDSGAPYTWASATTLVASPTYRDTSRLDAEAAACATLYAPLPAAPPHPYTLAARVYHKMLRTQRAQAITYQGLTDAGKSYTMKSVTQHLLTLSSSHSQQEAQLADRVQCAQQVLDAFGCAQTLAHEHASRHLTYWELHFTPRGRLHGARVLTAALDEHRLHGLLPGERAYAVFYQLLAGAGRAERQAYRLSEISMSAVPTREDARGFEWTQQALVKLGVKDKHIQGLWRVLAAILHLHAVDFEPDQDGVRPADPAALSRAADVLQVGAADLQQSLVMDTRAVKNERVTQMLDVAGARRQRDTLVQSLYGVLLAFVVEALNQKLAPPSAGVCIVQLDTPGALSRARVPPGPGRPGHYDDLVKNYIAELVRHWHLRSVLDPSGLAGVMLDEHLPILETRVPDDAIALLRGQPVPLHGDVPPPGGVLGAYADAYHAVSSGERAEDDQAPLVRALQALQGHRALIPPHPDGARTLFEINHALGSCAYTMRAHQRSEVNAFPPQQLELLRASRAPFVARLCAGPGLHLESRLTDQQVVVRAQVSSRPLRRPTPLGDTAVPWPEPRLGGVLEQVDEVLIALLRTMAAADTQWHVLCVRAMDASKPTVFDAKRVGAQVRGLGLASLVNAQRYSYTLMPHDAFEAQFGSLALVARARGWTAPHDYAIGQTCVCLSYAAWFALHDDVGPIHAAQAPVPTVHVSPVPSVDGAVPLQGGVAPHAVTPHIEVSHAEAPHAAASHAAAPHGGAARQSAASFETAAPHGAPPLITPEPVPYLHDMPGSEVSLLKQDDDAYLPDHLMGEPTWPLLDQPELLPPTEIEEVETTRLRRWWVRLTHVLTCWVPDSVLAHVLHKRRPDVRMAWREKVTICELIFLLCALILFYIVGLGRILCPNYDRAYNEGQLGEHTKPTSMYVAVAGDVYDITKFYKIDHSDVPAMPVTSDVMFQLAGHDLTAYFPVPLSVACRGLVTDPQLQMQTQPNLTAAVGQAVHLSGAAQPYNNTALNSPSWYYQRFLPRMKPYYKGYYVYDPKQLQTDGSWRTWAAVDGKVYDLSNYVYTAKLQQGANPPWGFLDNNVVEVFEAQPGQDVSDDFHAAMGALPPDVREETQACLDRAFHVGDVDFRLEAECLVQNYLLLAFSCLIFVSIFAKFLSALQLAPRPTPEQQDRFVICHIPCYTEGEDSLRKTIDSLATQQYDDKRKLLFVVCDGMIVGSGNEQPTPRIVLDILGVDAKVDPEPLPFKSVADGSKQLNYAKVYSGLYQHEGHVVPYVVVVKVGRPSEHARPGNRGKRDTQVMLMRYLNRVHTDAPMYPLELEVYHHMKNVIGIDPSFYEFILMVDADTTVAPDGLNRLVSATVDDPRTIAVCGETLLENEDATLWTMAQVYEYYISHNLAKAFESLFGSVTCLPGCFSMYRLRSSDKGRPLFVSDKVIDDYSENRVDTLHKKNLLALGEDRYLTTLLLKHFPLYRTKFRSDAQAMTVAPDSFSVLLSQRRRWINSTVHNLVELVMMEGLCGFCLFSMRFIVFIDLVGTIILPATAVYMAYLIIVVAIGKSSLPIIALVMIGAVYGLQAIIFLLKRQWQYIGWMVIYMIAFPLYAFLLPIYSFWHMDDFSWGNTRVVVGEKGNKKVVAGTDDEPYHDAMIPRKTVTEYQQEIYANGNDDHDVLLYDLPSSLGHGAWTQPDTSLQDDYFQHTNLLSKPAKRASQRASTASWGLGAFTRDSMPDSMHLPMYAPPPGYGMPPAPFPGMAMPMYPMPPTMPFAPSLVGSPDLGLHDDCTPSQVPYVYAEDPSDEQIRATIRSYLAAQPSLMQVTKRNVRDAVAEAMPNADLSGKRQLINSMVDQLLSGAGMD